MNSASAPLSKGSFWVHSQCWKPCRPRQRTKRYLFHLDNTVEPIHRVQLFLRQLWTMIGKVVESQTRVSLRTRALLAEVQAEVHKNARHLWEFPPVPSLSASLHLDGGAGGGTVGSHPWSRYSRVHFHIKIPFRPTSFDRFTSAPLLSRRFSAN